MQRRLQPSKSTLCSILEYVLNKCRWRSDNIRVCTPIPSNYCTFWFWTFWQTKKLERSLWETKVVFACIFRLCINLTNNWFKSFDRNQLWPENNYSCFCFLFFLFSNCLVGGSSPGRSGPCWHVCGSPGWRCLSRTCWTEPWEGWRRTHHRLTVAPLEVTGTLRGTLIQWHVSPPRATGARESHDIASCWRARKVLVEHAAAVSSCLAARHPSLLDVVQSGGAWQPRASVWECLAFWWRPAARRCRLISVGRDISVRLRLLLALWPLLNLLLVCFQRDVSLQTHCRKRNTGFGGGIKVIARNQGWQNVYHPRHDIVWLFNRALQ